MGHQIIMALDHNMGTKKIVLYLRILYKNSTIVIFFLESSDSRMEWTYTNMENARELGLENQMAQEWDHIKIVMKLASIC